GESEDGKPNGPPDHEAKDDQRDPGGFSESVELRGDRHCRPRVNVNNIYIVRPVQGLCQGASRLIWGGLRRGASPPFSSTPLSGVPAEHAGATQKELGLRLVGMSGNRRNHQRRFAAAELSPRPRR